MITFAAPLWALLALPLLAIGLTQRQLRLWEPLRAFCLILVVFALMQPRLRTLTTGLDLWVLVDRSASAADRLTRHLAEWETLIRQDAHTAQNRLVWIDYADTPIRRSTSDTTIYTGNASRTHLAQAIRYAQAQMDASRPSRLLVLTDGYSTEPLHGIAEQLAQQHVPLDYRLLTPASVRDTRMARLVLPSRVPAGAGFVAEAHLTGNTDGPVPYTITRNRVAVHRGTAQVRDGRGVIQFSDRLDHTGSHPYRIDIHPEPDAHPGNNTASGWVDSQGSASVLLITRYPDDPILDVLTQHGIPAQTATQPADLHVGHLTGTRAVILNNVAAYHLPTDFLHALDGFVRVQGGGLLMAGGKHAFGAGGYYGSTIDPLMPVAMELREEHRQYPVSMAIVLDRSGSMAAGVPGSSGLTKMDLANEGAAEAISLLGERDLITVFAVDSSPHLVVPVLPVRESRQHLINTVRAIRSQGGGIYVYNGLSAAWEALQQTDYAQRHIVLFADAADAEQPGDYQRLLRDIRQHGGTVSVIGLGTPADSDAAFLSDIAKRGEGRIFFAQNPHELPALFAQETVSVARSMFVEEPVGVQATGAWRDVAAEPLAWLPAIDGYNLSYSRPGASIAAVSTDTYRAPLTAFWQRGAGRTAAVTFPLAGDFSQRARAWPDYAHLTQTLVRWLMGPEQPPGIGLKTTVEGHTLTLDLLYQPDWETKLAQSAPQIFIARGINGKTQALVWERLAPGRYSTRTRLEDTTWVRGAVQIGETTLPFGPITASTDPEWTFHPARLQELKTLSQLSGGVERLDLTSAWETPAKAGIVELRPWLLVALLLSILADALLTRLGIHLSRLRWHLPQIPIKRAHATPSASQPTPSPFIQDAPPPPNPAESSEPAATSDTAVRRERFARAKARRS